MRTGCWAPKATNAHTHYAVRIAYTRRQWLQERAPVLRYTCIACLVYVMLHADALFAAVTQDATLDKAQQCPL
jgi:hypothetical protein